MGQEAEAEARRKAFAGFTRRRALMAAAEPDAIVLHCLPAHRGEEVSAEVIEGPQSLVWRGREPTARAEGAAGVAAGLTCRRAVGKISDRRENLCGL